MGVAPDGVGPHPGDQRLDLVRQRLHGFASVADGHEGPRRRSRLGCSARACALLDGREWPRDVLEGLPLGPHAEEHLYEGCEIINPALRR